MYFLKFSPDCMPRPPEMTILAEVSSGRSDFDSSAFSKVERPAAAGREIFSIGAEPLSPAAGKDVARTVMTFLASPDCTVWMALPAYIGRSKVSGETTLVMSEICITSSRAATRGRMFLPDAVAGATRAS